MPLRAATIIGFDVVQTVPTEPGVYEVWLRGGRALKVGIAMSLRKRLTTHAASRASGLKLKSGGKWTCPNDVMSKQSVLTKHLFFDREYSSQYDLCSENDRRRFLVERCEIRYRTTRTREEARAIERRLEKESRYKYVGRVVHHVVR